MFGTLNVAYMARFLQAVNIINIVEIGRFQSGKFRHDLQFFAIVINKVPQLRKRKADALRHLRSFQENSVSRAKAFRLGACAVSSGIWQFPKQLLESIAHGTVAKLQNSNIA